MKPLMIMATAAVLLLPPVALAADPVTFDEAKRLSSEQGKPLLVEFFRDD